MNEVNVSKFSDALVGEAAYTYERADGGTIDDHAWVTDEEYLEWEEDCVVYRKTWLLLGVERLVFNPTDPEPDE